MKNKTINIFILFINTFFADYYFRKIPLMQYLALKETSFDLKDLYKKISSFLDDKQEPLKDNNAIISITLDICSRTSTLMQSCYTSDKYGYCTLDKLKISSNTDLLVNDAKTAFDLFKEKSMFIIEICKNIKTGKGNFGDLDIALKNAKIDFDSFKKKAKGIIDEKDTCLPIVETNLN